MELARRRLGARVRGILATLLAGVAVGLLAPQAAGATESVSRVLVMSIPGVTWADIQNHDLPNIEGFLEDAAIANMAPRGVSPRSTPGAAYLTISAGARAVGVESVDGQQLEVDEQHGGSSAGEIYQRRTGEPPIGEYVSLAWPSVTRDNAREPYGAELGLLASTLSKGGLGATAIGNADGSETGWQSFERQVGLAVATQEGAISHAALGDDLLADDPSRPFGVTLDQNAVFDEFSRAWERPGGQDDGMVLVEASDLARVMRYQTEVRAERYEELYADALTEADALFGRLLTEVDPERDAVLLLSPYNLPGDRDLTISALQAPEAPSGYLRSASTQRSGFLTLVDVGPTILDLLGQDRPVAMEGRPAEALGNSASVSERVDHMVTRNEESRFREHLLFPTTLAVVVLLATACALAVVVISRGGWPRWDKVAGFGALAVMSMLPMSYVARLFPLESWGDVFYWAFLLASSVLVARIATLVANRLGNGMRGALIVVLSVVLAVPLIDVMFSSEMSLSAAFGYSATGNSRLYGISNYAFGHVSAASCLLAAFMVPKDAPTRRRLLAIGLLVVVLVIIGVPIWGSDVGGILAFTPTVLLFALLILQIKITPRIVLAASVLTALAVVAFGLIDLARPAGERAHLGRLLERVQDEGINVLLDMIERKGLAMLSVTGSSFWLAAVPVGLAFIVFLSRYPGRPFDPVYRRDPNLRAGLIVLYTAAILGTLANDSGVIIGGMALTVAAASLVVLALEATARPDTVAFAEIRTAQEVA